jgi:methyl-accepting chemotaxis protein
VQKSAGECPWCGSSLAGGPLSVQIDRMGTQVAHTAHEVVGAARALPKEVADEIEEVSRALTKHVTNAKGDAQQAWVETKSRISQETRRGAAQVRHLATKGKAVRHRVVRASHRVERKVRATAKRVTRRASGTDPSSTSK